MALLEKLSAVVRHTEQLNAMLQELPQQLRNELLVDVVQGLGLNNGHAAASQLHLPLDPATEEPDVVQLPQQQQLTTRRKRTSNRVLNVCKRAIRNRLRKHGKMRVATFVREHPEYTLECVERAISGLRRNRFLAFTDADAGTVRITPRIPKSGDWRELYEAVFSAGDAGITIDTLADDVMHRDRGWVAATISNLYSMGCVDKRDDNTYFASRWLD